MTALDLQCRCGEVRVTVTGEPIAQMYCHCDDCQAVHGAAYVPESVYPAAAVTVTSGAPTTWKLKRNPRVTCPSCGTRLFIDVLAFGLRGVNGCLLPPGAFKPTFHVNCKFAVAPVKDELPHYAGMPSPNYTATVLTGILGVAGVAAGTVFGLVATNDKASLEHECTSAKVCPASAQDDIDAFSRNGTISTVAFGVGAAGLLLSGILFFHERGKDAPAQARVTPWIGPGAGGLTGRF